MSKSILQSDELIRCFVTHETRGRYGQPLERHHVLNGALRDFAEREGLWIWVTPEVHRWLHDTGQGVMIQKNVLKRYAQIVYERTHSREEWMRQVHKNYDV